VTRVTILDHGYLELIETWGSEERIIEAARMSTGKGFKGWSDQCERCGLSHKEIEELEITSASRFDDEAQIMHTCRGVDIHSFREVGDEKLLRFLYENNHATPFEMAGAIVEVQGPIFVFREWHRHRTQSYNEMSARYTPLPDVNYLPTIGRLMMNGGANKQAQGTGATLTLAGAESFRIALKKSYAAAQALYEEALEAGVPKELARVHLPVGRYSRMRASANLRNWLAFLTLRAHPTAQWEIRQYAEALLTALASVFPRTLSLFVEKR